MIIFEILKKVNESTKDKARQLFYKHINQLDNQTYIKMFENITLIQIKEFLRIYKCILHRTLLYCSTLTINTSLMSENLHLVDNLLTKIRVNEIKRKQTAFVGDIYDILYKDQIIFELIQDAVKESDF